MLVTMFGILIFGGPQFIGSWYFGSWYFGSWDGWSYYWWNKFRWPNILRAIFRKPYFWVILLGSYSWGYQNPGPRVQPPNLGVLSFFIPDVLNLGLHGLGAPSLKILSMRVPNCCILYFRILSLGVTCSDFLSFGALAVLVSSLGGPEFHVPLLGSTVWSLWDWWSQIQFSWYWGYQVWGSKVWGSQVLGFQVLRSKHGFTKIRAPVFGSPVWGS